MSQLTRGEPRKLDVDGYVNLPFHTGHHGCGPKARSQYLFFTQPYDVLKVRWGHWSERPRD